MIFRSIGQVTSPRGGVREQSQKINNVHVAATVKIVEEHPDYTLAQIKAELQLKIPNEPAISIVSLCNILKSQLIIVKKLEDIPCQRNLDVVKDRRSKFAEWFLHEGVNQELVFIDEAGFNLWLRRSKGRAPVGERAVRVVTGQRGANLTMTFVVSSSHGIMHHNLQQGSITAV